MKKIILTLIAAIILSIGVLGGIQNPFAENMHVMGGMIMMDHEMSSPDCNAQRCFINPDNEHMQAAAPSQPDFERMLLAAVLGLFLTVLTAWVRPLRFRKLTDNSPNLLAIDIGSVVFRE